MENIKVSTKNEELKRLIAEAQKEPGLLELMTVYGNLNEEVQKTQEYLSLCRPKSVSSLSNNSS